MTLRDDVRDYFEHEARRQPAPASLRADVTSRAVASPSRTSSLRWAAVVAAMLATAIVIGLVATGAFRQSRGVPVGPPIPVTPGTHGFVFDVSFANSNDGWALLGEPSKDKSMAQYYVETTHDGGATWLTPVPVGRPYRNGTGDSQPRHVHFVDRDNGFVYGGVFTFVTHDGGRTWLDAGLPSNVVAVTGQEGVAWGVSANCPAPACSYSVYVSPDGGKSWLRAAPVPVVPSGAVSFGITGLLVTASGSNDLAVTTDSGTTWAKITGPCPAGTAINGAATADGREIWDVCSPLPPPNAAQHHPAPMSSVFVSEDSGKTWQSRGETPAGIGVEIVLSPTVGTALVATDTSQMQISHDAGQSWRECVTDGKHSMLSASFSADGSIAVAVDNVYVVWISRDGGNTWNRAASQP